MYAVVLHCLLGRLLLSLHAGIDVIILNVELNIIFGCSKEQGFAKLARLSCCHRMGRKLPSIAGKPCGLPLTNSSVRFISG